MLLQEVDHLMLQQNYPRRRGRADVQAFSLACGGIAATALLSAAAFTSCPPAAARAAVAVGAVILCALTAAVSRVLFRRISNPSFQDLSNTDALTGLKSRTAFEVDLANLQAGHTPPGAGVLLIDLNNLKLINDQLGHRAGDGYLQLAAQALRSGAERGTLCYRVGGDELAALVPGGTEADMAALAARTRAWFVRLRPAPPGARPER